MSPKKLIVISIFLISPYLIYNYFIFFFLIPLLFLFYARVRIKNLHLVLFPLVLCSVILLPIVTYKVEIYLAGILITACFISGFLLLSKSLIKRLEDPLLSICVPAILWTALLYLFNFRSLLASAFDIGVLFPTSVPIIWYTGSIGITLLIILFNSAIARHMARRDKVSLFVSIVLFIAFLGSLVFSLTQNADLSIHGQPKRIALIQGDIPEKTIFGFTENLDKRIKRYIDLSREAANKGTDVVVWPEYTFPVDIVNRFPGKMRPVIDEIKRSKTTYIIGSMLRDQEKKNILYNTALIFDKQGKVEDTYYSQDPAIFNEGISPRKNNGKLYLDQAGITLCWEEINEKIYRDYVKSGAEYFISLSSNTDLDYSWFKKYASFFTRARAAENMRYLARAAQTGVTQIINPYGRAIRSVPQDTATFLTGNIYRIKKETFYSRNGDILVKLFILSVIVYGFIKESILKIYVKKASLRNDEVLKGRAGNE